MKSIRLLPCLLASLLLAGSAQAQTATWIGSAGSRSDLHRWWSDHSSWDTGMAPDGSTATAVFTLASDRAVAITGLPGRAVPLIEGSTVTLGSLRYALPEIPDDQRISLTVRNNGRLVIEGDGILLDSNATYGVQHSIYVGPAGGLELAGNARVQNLRGLSGSLHIWLGGGDYYQPAPLSASLRLSDNANLGSAVVGVTTSAGWNVVTFRGSASAARATLLDVYRVEFGETSTASGAGIRATQIAFTDSANAGTAGLAVDGQKTNATVTFADQSSAGSAMINLGRLGRLSFSGQADAGTATANLGDGEIVIAGAACTAGLTITGGSPFLFRGRLDISQADQDVELRAVDHYALGISLGPRSLVFNDATPFLPSTLAGIITGSGGLVWNRTNILTVRNRANDFTGLTRISRGQLLLQDGRLAETEIGDASLRGSGVIAGHLRNSGMLIPDALQVNGNYTQNSGGTLLIGITSPTDPIRLVVSGTAFLDGRLFLSFAPGFQPVGSSNIDFLQAGSVSGQFATINLPTDMSAALSHQVQYTAKGVRLAVTQHPFISFGGIPAGTALGAHLDDTLADSTGSHRTFLHHLNGLSESSQVSTALEALSPDRYAALPEENLYGALLRNAAHDARLAAARRQSERGLTVFFDATRRDTRFDASNGLPEAGATTSGCTAGVWWRNGSHLLGIAVTQEDIALEFDTLGSRADSKLLAPTVTYQFTGDGFFFNASASSARSENDLLRIIRYPGTDNAAVATTNSRHTTATASVGRAFQAGAWTLTPQVALLQSRWRADAFTESGYAPLEISEWSMRSLHVRAGLEASCRGNGFTPALAVTWLHEADRTQSFQAGFASTSSRYAVPDREAGRNFVSARFSIEKSLGQHAMFTVGIGGLWGRDARINTDLAAGFLWEF